MSEYAIISRVPGQTMVHPTSGRTVPMMQVWYVDLPNLVFVPYETEGVGIADTPDEIANEVANYLGDLCEEEEI